MIGGWFYDKPDLSPDNEGNVVLISKQCIGPLEVYQWGLDKNNNPYELYKWLENDFFEDSNYCRTITKEELLKRIAGAASLFEKNGLSEWTALYEVIVERLRSDSAQYH